MSIAQIRQKFIDRTARKPNGEWAKKNYSDPKSHYRSFEIILEKLQLKDDDSYVEIGCGGGKLLEDVFSIVNKAAAIDHSADMIKVTGDKFENICPKELDLVHGDAAKLPWENDSFTAAASANMFFFIPKPQEVLNEIYRVLKPNGRFAMVTMKKGILTQLSFGFLYSLNTYTNQEMETMFKEAGFKNIKIESYMFMWQLCYGEK